MVLHNAACCLENIAATNKIRVTKQEMHAIVSWLRVAIKKVECPAIAHTRWLLSTIKAWLATFNNVKIHIFYMLLVKIH